MIPNALYTDLQRNLGSRCTYVAAGAGAWADGSRIGDESSCGDEFTMRSSFVLRRRRTIGTGASPTTLWATSAMDFRGAASVMS